MREAATANDWHDIGHVVVGRCSTPQPSPTVTPAPTPTQEVPEWDCVALGDSVTFGMIPHYAEMLEQDLGVKIKVHNWSAGGDHSSRLLERLRTNELLRQDLREAQVITQSHVFKNEGTAL